MFISVAGWPCVRIQLDCGHRSPDDAQGLLCGWMVAESVHDRGLGIHQVCSRRFRPKHVKLKRSRKIASNLFHCSYVTVTFVVEAMAAANAVRRFKRIEILKQVTSVQVLPV